MDAEITWHTGIEGDALMVHVDWFDHNNVRQKTDVRLAMQSQDKPRQFQVSVNSVVVAVVPASIRAEVARVAPKPAEPNLGCATTLQLIDELATRAHVDASLGEK